ncbi:hypothetical protein [Kitasatospora fiedleri]|uniref:hypothetical protein n=1 Tax=Kitasatospora fiedleri TaxID=2991545 RepID=UPI00249A94CD|nr:hypothetical protein [Kitasatospora fiedleri]
MSPPANSSPTGSPPRAPCSATPRTTPETRLEFDVKVAESPEIYTLVVQRHAPGALTPHEARQRAEARVAELERDLAGAPLADPARDGR